MDLDILVLCYLCYIGLGIFQESVDLPNIFMSSASMKLVGPNALASYFSLFVHSSHFLICIITYKPCELQSWNLWLNSVK